MKTIVTLLLLIPFLGFAQIKLPEQVKKVIPTKLPSSSSVLSSNDISKGLKEALNNGIAKQVTKLTAEDGFYKNELVKILLPEELQKVDKTLRKLGLSSLAEEGILMLNRVAEDAVNEATPIFVEAVKIPFFSLFFFK